MAIKGIIKLERPILCSEEVLGKDILTTIGKYDIHIMFPVLPMIDYINPEVGRNNPLVAPDSFSDWTKVDWGYPTSYPTISAMVSTVGLLFADTTQSTSDIQDAYNRITAWQEKLLDMCALLKPGILYRDKNLRESDARVHIYDDLEYVQNEEPCMLYLHFIDSKNALSYEDVLLAIDYASSGSELKMEYKMMLSAYEARRQCDNRKVVLEVCSAVELCLVKRIENYCDEKHIEVSILTKKYKTLGDRFRLVGMIDEEFNESTYRDITRLRNNVFHSKNVDPSDEETDAMINKAEECLRYFRTTYY